MDLIFAGSGGSFTVYKDNYHSNMIFQNHNKDRMLLIDCGSDIKNSLFDLGISYKQISDIYISHVHSDHIGGLEWLALLKKLDKNEEKPNLYISEHMAEDLWKHSLEGGLSTFAGEEVGLESYFKVHKIKNNGHFIWDGVQFNLVQTIHFFSGYALNPSYGLIFKVNGKTVLLTTDTQFYPDYFNFIYNQADIIFQDCETSAKRSGVHAHFDDLCTLDKAIRNKMWLYHHNSKHPYDAKAKGFLGFVQRGQKFKF